jgi:hypothetical protein
MNDFLQEYTKSNITICLGTFLSIVMTMFCFVGPIRYIFFLSLLIKLVTIVLTLFILYINVQTTSQLSSYKKRVQREKEEEDGFLLESAKSNVITGYILSIALVVLILTLIRSLF